MGNTNCCCRKATPTFAEGSTQTQNNYYFLESLHQVQTTTTTTEQISILSDRKNLEESDSKNDSNKHRRIKSEIPNTNGDVSNASFKETNAITATKHANFLSPDAKGNHQKNLSTSITTQTIEENTRKEKPKKKIAFKDDQNPENSERTNEKISINQQTPDKTSQETAFNNQMRMQNLESLENSEKDKNSLEKNPKRIMFKESINNIEETDVVADRGRSRTNFGKKSINETLDLDAKIPKRSKSCDTGKSFFERQSKEIDEIFEVLTNFQSFKLRMGNKLSCDNASPNLLDEDYDNSSSSSSSENSSDEGNNNNNNEDDENETDLIQIADVAKYISKRLSKREQFHQEQHDYEVSPTMKKFLGKFYNENGESVPVDAKNQINLFSDALEEKKNSTDLKTTKTINKTTSKKITTKPAPPKLERRNSEKDIAKRLEDDIKIKKLLEELHLFNRYGSNFTVKVNKGRPLIKTGGGFITLENYLERVLNKLAKKNKKSQAPKIQLNPYIIQKLSDYLVSMAEKNEIVAKDSGSSKFVTARVQRRPTGWTVKNKKPQPKKDLQINEKISVQMVSPNRGFKF